MTTRNPNRRSELPREHQSHTALAACREISQRLLEATTPEQTASAAMPIIVEAFAAEGGVLLLLAAPDAPADAVREYGAQGDALRVLSQALRRHILQAVTQGRAPLIETDAAALLARAGLTASALRNLLAMPLLLGAGCLGALVVYNFRSPQNLPRYAEEAAALLSPIVHSIACVRLLQERDRQARMLETIIEDTDTHIAYLDADFNFVRVNSAYVKGCGHARAELIGHNHFEFFPNPENEDIFRRVRDTKQPVQYREKPFTYIDQPERGVTYWDWILTPVTDERGAVEGLVLSLTDMTEKVRARERLLEAERARAEMAETLAAEVNHRMKNNLAIVAGLLHMQVVQRPEGDPVTVLRQAIARIRSLAAVHEQMSETHADQVELVDALRRIGDIAREALAAGEVEVSVQGQPLYYPSKVGTTLCVVANELLTNAVKYGAPEADGRLRIKLSVAVREGRLRLSVWNSGNPVARDFDPSDRHTMGLRLVHDLVVGQWRGSFTVRPHRGGTLAEIMVDDQALRGQD